MFAERVEEKSIEVERAKERKEQLEEQIVKLETQNELVTKKIIESQLDRAKNNEILTKLKREFMQKKVKYERDQHELDFANCASEQLTTLKNETSLDYSSSVLKEKYVKEYLDFKSQMTNCLSQELFEVRQKVAENEEIIKELDREKLELELDYATLKALTPDTVASLQEALIQVKERNMNISNEFEQVKKFLEETKKDWFTCLKTHNHLDKNNEFDIYIHGLWNKDDSNERVKHLKENKESVENMEQEVVYLRSQLTRLESHYDDMSIKYQLNEEALRKLDCEIENCNINELRYLKDKKNLEENFNKIKDEYLVEMIKIKERKSSHNEDMLRLLDKLIDVEKKGVYFESKVHEFESVESLENLVKSLETKIKLLKLENQYESEC